MTVVTRRRVAARVVRLDRSLEALPLFRLSDSADDSAITWNDDESRRWRVIPGPDDRRYDHITAPVRRLRMTTPPGRA